MMGQVGMPKYKHIVAIVYYGARIEATKMALFEATGFLGVCLWFIIVEPWF